ncbi:MAG TPA: M23 family metallopeptidase [Clostridium sp.]|uniref:M23 family metallopeptidase n=1 Tax=Clostridium sp. TaxID=1506 RepID=UPI002F920424
MIIKFLQFPVTAKFGAIDSIHKIPHSGVDIGAPLATPAQSLTNGVVDRIINDNIIGNGIGVKLDSGKEMVYGHLSKINITYGQNVKVGDVLGLTGNTGRSTGPHIHIGLISNGQYLDPSNYLAQPTTSNPMGFFQNTWHVLTTPGTQLLDEAKQSVFNKFLVFLSDLFHWVIQNSDYALLLAMLFALLAIFGSKKAVKGVYWTFAFYIILKFLGVVTL